MLQRYPNIHRAVINDINSDLITCYRTIRDTPEELIRSLQELENTFFALQNEEERKALYLTMRDRYNQKGYTPVENTTMFIFMNRTCFNGLYRVNKKGSILNYATINQLISLSNKENLNTEHINDEMPQ